MAITANHSAPKYGKFRHAISAVWAFLQAIDSTSVDYTLGRIERLEREVGRLKEELRQVRDPGASMLTTGTPSNIDDTRDDRISSDRTHL
ncbi:MAG: hypothetical protein K2W78_00360 [Xanthobacteraceae bacterium]|nr:hypothetical protein [Xanthobacteraceae bacterium]